MPAEIFARRHLLGIEGLSRPELENLLDLADAAVDVSRQVEKKRATLRGRTLINLFFEASTRTQSSFELAGKRLGADVMNMSVAASSVKKGETLIDTAITLNAMRPDIIVVRHHQAGAAHLLARKVDCSVVNAGDGAHEHPTQALLDCSTIRKHKGRLEGLDIVICGDIRHSRVARSNIWALLKLGANVTLCGPSTLVPRVFEQMGCRVTYNVDEAIADADIINLLRIQHERQRKSMFPSLGEYVSLFGLNKKRMERTKPGVLIMHPGPINRGVEIDSEIADCGRSVILDQVTNGLAVRMAVLFLVNGGKGPQEVAA
jgi:aspartate carbamoyltransferase catalytic subunit